MSGLGAAANIAGLAGLAGQTIQSLANLYSFIQSYQNVHPKVMQVVEELQHLESCLRQVQNSASHAKNVLGSPFTALNGLTSSITECQSLLGEIEALIDPLKAESTSNVIKRLKAAADKDYFPTIHHRLSRHRQQLTVLIASSAWYVSRSVALPGVDTSSRQTQDHRHTDSRSSPDGRRDGYTSTAEAGTDCKTVKQPFDIP